MVPCAGIQDGDCVGRALPTLLTSRPAVETEFGTRRGRAKPLCPAIEVPEEVDVTQVQRLESDGHTGVCIKNTFLDTAERRSPSLEDFYRERGVRTCPGVSVGRLRGLFGEREAAPPDALEGGVLHQPEPSRGRTVVSLADSLVEGPLRPHPSGPDMNGVPQAVQYASRSHEIQQAMQPSPGAHMAVAPEVPYVQSMAYVEDYGFTCPSTSGAIPIDYGFACQALQPQQLEQGHYGAAQQCDYVPHQQFALPGAYEQQYMMPAAPSPALALPLSCGNEAALTAGVGPVQAMPLPPAGPALGTEELPSMGSQGHALGTCKPCAFLHTKGCENGLSCQFCHLCESGEKKRRRKTKP